MPKAKWLKPAVLLGLAAALCVWAYYNSVTLCLFKRLFGIPCPGCGLTRAFMSIALYADFGKALYYNPLSLVLSVMAIAAAARFVACRVKREKFSFKWPSWAVPAAAMAAAASWAFNIIKGI